MYKWKTEKSKNCGLKYRLIPIYNLIGFWDTQYDIAPVISTNIGANITDMADSADIDGWYWQY